VSPLVLGILVVLALLMAALGLTLIVQMALQSRQRERLQQRITPTVANSDPGADTASGRRLIDSVARSGRLIEGWVDADNESARLMSQAGWRSQESRLAWYAFQGLVPLAGVAVVVAFAVLGSHPQKMLYLAMLAFVAFALSVLIPRWVLRAAAAGRRARIKGEVPLFIHLLVLLFEAGLSTRQALTSLVREVGGVLPELGAEFAILLRSIDAGADTSEVLKNLGDALEVEELSSVLAVLRQVDRYGGEVREPLLEALTVLEARRSLELREKVNILSGRMTVVMVLFFFPALLIFVAGPAFLSVIRALNNVAG
jgi:tight adherence protein C